MESTRGYRRLPPGAVRPITQPGAILLREPRLRVQRQVVPERHLAFLDVLPDLLEVLAALLLRVGVPGREVHLLARLVDVVREQPGDGREEAVPGPARLPRVAVVTGPL